MLSGSRPFLDDESFVMYLGDNLISQGFREFLRIRELKGMTGIDDSYEARLALKITLSTTDSLPKMI